MARTVTVNQDAVALPDGNIYNEGDTATLTDEQYARIPESRFEGGSPMLTDEGYQSDLVIESPNGTAWRIVVDNSGALSAEEV